MVTAGEISPAGAGAARWPQIELLIINCYRGSNKGSESPIVPDFDSRFQCLHSCGKIRFRVARTAPTPGLFRNELLEPAGFDRRASRGQQPLVIS